MKKYNNVRHDTEANWSRAINFVPPEGELIIYDGMVENGRYVVEPKFKLGDGITKINDLPFLFFGAPKAQSAKFEDGALVFPEEK